MPQLYMFAIMPPLDVANSIDTERKFFAKKYNCYRALKPPVHITLCPPFEYKGDMKAKVAALHNWAAAQSGFAITMHNFGFFKNRLNPVVFIDVVKDKSLDRFQQEFIARLEQHVPALKYKSYTPHFTIGYRDVPPELMPAIERDYSNRTFSNSFNMNSFFLWQHDGKAWQIIDEYTLKT